ncbi:MAG: pirin family protein [Cryomorphaceae bacterium]|nr:pirin family protein [Cryomorphaceae bacterium]
MDQLPTWTALPNRGVRQIDPFILINHHGPTVYGKHNDGLPFGPHPHRGFETLTFILKGELQHRDSTGHVSNITEGGVQWMTAGSGIVHAEESSAHFREHGGELEVIQLWFNLPPEKKMTPPNYHGLQSNEITQIQQDGILINLVSGQIEEHRGPIESLTGHVSSSIHMEPGKHLQLTVPGGRNVLFYIVSGEAEVNGQSTATHQLIEFASTGGYIDIASVTGLTLLFCHGEPTNAPLASYGPFVMNTNEEIHQAMRDYQEGRMGVL